jgi:hypothetical protein
MSKFKAVAIDYAFYASLSDEPQSVCLTPKQMYVLSVQNTYSYWLTRWYNTDDINQTIVNEIASEIEEVLMCGCGIPEPTLTDRYNTTNYISNTNTIYDDVYNTWNDAGQTIVSIAPQLDIDTGDPVDIDRLFCLAFRMLINALCQTAIQQAGQDTNGRRDIVKGISAALTGVAGAGGIALGIGGAGAGLVAFIGGPWTLLGLAIGGVAVGIGSLFIQSDVSAYEDTIARDDVLCAIYNKTTGLAMTESAFSNALSDATFSPSSNAGKIATMMQPFLSDQTMYLQFLSLANQLYNVINLTALPDCPCQQNLVPIINSVWDPLHISGTLSGPDSGGMWTVTTTDRTSDRAFTLMATGNVDFVLTDITYSANPSCQVFVLNVSPFYIGCPGINVYSAQACDEFHSTWAGTGPYTMNFRMIAP